MPYDVLHTLGSAQSGFRSFARIVSALSMGLDPARYRVHAWFLGEDGPVVQELRAAGAEVRVIGWRNGFRDPAGAFRFWNALRSQAWDIIHVHAGAGTLRCLGRLGSQATVIQHLHARNTDDNSPNGFRPCAKKLWGADAVIATSRAVADLVVKKQPYVVYPGVVLPDAPSRRSSTNEQSREVIIGAACRIVAVKGLSYLLKSAAMLCPEIPQLRIEIAGSGPAREQLERESRELGLGDRVRFLGWQTDIFPVMNRWDVFAMPSLEEGFGIAALEAMAAGLPVVASNVGGVPELVEHGRTGWLVPPSDVAALADRLRALLLDAKIRSVMGSAGRERARNHFPVQRMVGEISKIYDGLVGC
ncbi:MAG: glycosyltransferase [Acidobacteria bacterium]|nr:glycosyltransferase [Acidobacteriota bacterium]